MCFSTFLRPLRFFRREVRRSLAMVAPPSFGLTSTNAQGEWFANDFYKLQRRVERVAAVSGAIAFFALAFVALARGLPPWVWPLMVGLGILVPIWILLVRRNLGPITYRLSSSGIELEFLSRATSESRNFSWNAVQIVVRRGTNPPNFLLRLPVHPGQEERVEWVREPVGHAERFTWPCCHLSVDEGHWSQIEALIPEDAKVRLRHSQH